MSKPKDEKAMVEVKDEGTAMVIAPISFADDAGAGQEEADKNSFAIPFLAMLQGLSPQIETLEGAKPGLIINTITNELFSKVRVIHCAFQRRYLRWVPRSKGGGYRGEFNPAEVETGRVEGLKEFKGTFLMDVPPGVDNPFDGDGHAMYDHLADTRNHFVLYETATGSWKPALVSLASTQIKRSKRWMSRIQGIEMLDSKGKKFNPASFSHIYEITPEQESNAKGKWYSNKIELVGPVTDPEVYAAAKAFHQTILSGKFEVAPPVPPADAGDWDKEEGSGF